MVPRPPSLVIDLDDRTLRSVPEAVLLALAMAAVALAAGAIATRL